MPTQTTPVPKLPVPASTSASPRDEKLRRVIELTYFRPAPKQEAAADRLSLSFGTYRRHRTTALGRLARWLWDQERATVT
jgi:hypothetical protein